MIAGYKPRTRNKGFSLVELVIVLGVIALMLGAISPVIVSQYRKGQAGKAIATIETLREAVGHYIEMTGAISFADFNDQDGNPKGIETLISKRIIPGSFANEKNPWGGSYSLSSSDGVSYTITLSSVPQWAWEKHLINTYGNTSAYSYNGNILTLTLTFY